jgi:hypothetical protein
LNNRRGSPKVIKPIAKLKTNTYQRSSAQSAANTAFSYDHGDGAAMAAITCDPLVYS